ncbi:hypothetical protein [Rhodococcus sp. NPDC058639]|uniref:hypothetical protein n=1 Tax=Rhodococcus sp. NPDC058639 TaxID=3346570 RepID=UPI00364EA239
MWHEMAGLVDPAPISQATQELFDYGHAAELAAREFWLRRNPGWRASQKEVQYHRTNLPGIWLAAATIDRRASRGSSRKIVEVKTARDLEEFGDDGSGEIPIDYCRSRADHRRARCRLGRFHRLRHPARTRQLRHDVRVPAQVAPGHRSGRRGQTR